MFFSSVITADAKVYACLQYRQNPDCFLGDLNQNTLAEIFRSDRMRAVYEKIDCSKCPPFCRNDVFNRTLHTLSNNVNHKRIFVILRIVGYKKMNEENWPLIIKPKRKLLEIPIREIIRYRDLIFLFVKRDFTTQYKQTILGPLWFVLTPFFSTITYTFIFGRLANIGTDGIPHTLFYFSGTILWNFFFNCFNESSNVFISNANIFGKIYFPRLVVPINYVFSNSIKSFLQFFVLVILFIYFVITGSSVRVSWLMLLFPLIFIWLAAISVGAGIIISSLTTKYRDLKNIVGFALNLGMYATPVVYPISEIPDRFRWIAYVNPVSAPIELFREWFFGASSVDTKIILFSLGFTAVLVFTGLILFNQNEQKFIDVI